MPLSAICLAGKEYSLCEDDNKDEADNGYYIFHG